MVNINDFSCLDCEQFDDNQYCVKFNKELSLTLAELKDRARDCKYYFPVYDDAD